VPAPTLLHSSVGDYRLVEFLGAGGMGEVYRAVHAKIGRNAAVKVLTGVSPGLDTLERFRNEARVQATLHHPNIATLYDFLEVDGRPCIVMEYVDGETLADAIRLRGRVPPPAAWVLFRDIVAAVAYVHEQGVVHRDLKSGNVRVSSLGVVKLLDFGIAKSELTSHLTQAGSLVGTLQYLAPEQLRGEPASARSDVWGLGIVLYEILTGRVPFDAATVGQLLEKIHTASYDRPSIICGDGTDEERTLLALADRVVAKCLRRTPADRYPSARHLLEDIERACGPSRRDRRGLAGAERPSLPSDNLPVAPGRLQGLAEAALAGLERYWMMLTVAALVGLAALAWLAIPGSETSGRAGDRTADVPVAAEPRADLSGHRLDVAEGSAEVYINGTWVGRTPLEYQARPNETVTLELKQPGFVSYRDTFDITKKGAWTFVMSHDAGRD